MFPLPFQIGSIGPIWATFETKPENVSTVFDVNLLITHRYRCRYYKGGGRGRYFLRAKAAAAIFKGQGCGRYFLRAKAAAAIFKGQGCVRYFLRVKAATFILGCYFRSFFLCKLHFVFIEASIVLGRTSVELRLSFGGTSAELRRNFS